MSGDDLGGPPHLHAAAVLQFAQQEATVFCVQRARRGGAPRRKLIDAGADGFRAGGIERLARSILRIDADELADGALKTLEQRQVDVQAKCGDIRSARILDADRGGFGLPAVGERVGVVRDHLRVVRIGNAGEPELRCGLPDLASREIVVDGDDRMLRIGEIVQHDFAERSKRFAEPLGDPLQLVEQNLPIRGFLRCAGGWLLAAHRAAPHCTSSATVDAALRPEPVRMTTVFSPGLIAPASLSSAAAALALVGSVNSPCRASRRSAATISSSVSAIVPPPLSRSAAMISRRRIGCLMAVPSAIVLRTSRATGVWTPAWNAASIGEQFSGCAANRRGSFVIWPAFISSRKPNAQPSRLLPAPTATMTLSGARK